ncbi:hypothetical protein ACSBR1_012010 [Camellia fascicularis]
MGFYKPGKSSNYYISMWYKEVSLKTIVWVANRDTPIYNKYSLVLKILDGNLVHRNESQIIIWSTNQNLTTTTSLNYVDVVLGDNGNLVLRDRSKSSSTQQIWQSFDYLTHTWLPGSKIAYNKCTNTHRGLTSWKNSEYPPSRPFSLDLDANHSHYHDNENKSYFIYSIYDPSIVSRFIIEILGQVKQLAWLDANKRWNSYWAQPRPQYKVYAFCGAFGTCNENILPFRNYPNGFNPLSSNEWNLMSYSGGCVKRTKLVCGNNHERDMFWEYPNTRLPKHPQSLVAKTVVECETTFLNNYSCTAYAYDSNGCSIWIEDLLNMQKLLENDDRRRTLYIRVAASKYSSGKLSDFTAIAVKKLESVNQGEKQFRVEVSTLGTIQYVKRRSLDSHLFHEMKSKVLDWKTRYQIALGTAKGLAYLHVEYRDCIIHRDIKPTNILLDVDFIPKVADFGLAKLLWREFSKVLTTTRETTEYLAPEWILGVAIINKVDGEEILQSEAIKYFPIWASSVVIEGGDVLSLLDNKLGKHVDVEELWRICKLSSWCIQDDTNHRPSMGEVVLILKGILDVKQSPIPRLLQALVNDK